MIELIDKPANGTTFPDNKISVRLIDSSYDEIIALIKLYYPEFKGYLITQSGDQQQSNIYTINVSHEQSATMNVVESSEDRLQSSLRNFIKLNHVYKCVNESPEIKFVGQLYSADLTFIF